MDGWAYHVLNRDAKNWHYYKRLREQGNHTEARRRERESIKDRVKTLRETIRNGGHWSIGRGGWTLNVSDNCKLSGYENTMQCDIIDLFIGLGIPGYSTLTVPESKIVKFAVSGPLITVERDDKKTNPGALSFVPFKKSLDYLRSYGVTLFNIENLEDMNNGKEKSNGENVANRNIPQASC